jgi:hypothetical protein
MYKGKNEDIPDWVNRCTRSFSRPVFTDCFHLLSWICIVTQHWLQSNAFDTAKACEDYLIDSYTRAEAKFRSVASVENKRSFDSLTFARCIVTDDPRLK